MEMNARSHRSQFVEDVAATGMLVQGRLSDGDASSWPILHPLRWISLRRILRAGGNWRQQDVRRRRERAVIGIDVLALQREAFRSCKPDTYLFTDKPVLPSFSPAAKSASAHGNAERRLQHGLSLSRTARPGRARKKAIVGGEVVGGREEKGRIWSAGEGRVGGV